MSTSMGMDGNDGDGNGDDYRRLVAEEQLRSEGGTHNNEDDDDGSDRQAINGKANGNANGKSRRKGKGKGKGKSQTGKINGTAADPLNSPSHSHSHSPSPSSSPPLDRTSSPSPSPATTVSPSSPFLPPSIEPRSHYGSAGVSSNNSGEWEGETTAASAASAVDSSEYDGGDQSSAAAGSSSLLSRIGAAVRSPLHKLKPRSPAPDRADNSLSEAMLPPQHHRPSDDSTGSGSGSAGYGPDHYLAARHHHQPTSSGMSAGDLSSTSLHDVRMSESGGATTTTGTASRTNGSGSWSDSNSASLERDRARARTASSSNSNKGSENGVGKMNGMDGNKDVAAISVLETAVDEAAEEEEHYTHIGSNFLPGPPCVRNILGNELCERFSYYGLRAILTLYFHESLGWSKPDAISVFSYSSALAYFMPLIGGFISDAHWGKYHTILRFSSIYVLGGALLAIAAWQKSVWLSIVGLVGIGVGTGGIKPCVSSFGADQFTRGVCRTHEALKAREENITKFFHCFYFCINLGSVCSFIITPLLKEYAGYDIAFAVPAILLACAIVVFWTARHQYYRTPVSGSVLSQVIKVGKIAWARRRDPIESPPPPSMSTPPAPAVTPSASVASPHSAHHNWLDSARGDARVSNSDIENAKALWRVLPIFAVLPAFWMLFDQQGSSWTLQAKSMQLYGLQPEQVGVVNPLLIMILLPIFGHYLYPAIQRCGIDFTPLRRMGVGMLIACGAFLLSALVQTRIDGHAEHSVSVFLQLPQVLLITTAEILISVTGLEFSYTQATPALKSCITAIFLITTAIGDLLTGVIYNALDGVVGMATMFVIFAALMFANFFIFLYVASKYRPVVVLDERVREPEEEEETEEERLMRMQSVVKVDENGMDQQHQEQQQMQKGRFTLADERIHSLDEEDEDESSTERRDGAAAAALARGADTALDTTTLTPPDRPSRSQSQTGGEI